RQWPRARKLDLRLRSPSQDLITVLCLYGRRSAQIGVRRPGAHPSRQNAALAEMRVKAHVEAVEHLGPNTVRGVLLEHVLDLAEFRGRNVVKSVTDLAAAAGHPRISGSRDTVRREVQRGHENVVELSRALEPRAQHTVRKVALRGPEKTTVDRQARPKF